MIFAIVTKVYYCLVLIVIQISNVMTHRQKQYLNASHSSCIAAITIGALFS